MPPTALIVEDETDASEILAELVSHRGFRPLQAYTGKEGLAKAQADSPDVMLLDLMLPDIDGFEVCERLRAKRETNLIPVVMATALAETEHKVHGFRVGANCYVIKPYTGDQIFRAIDEALRWKARMIEGQVEGEVNFDLTSDTAYLVQVNNLLSSLLLLTPLDERSIERLHGALLEMGQNAIEWGNQNDPSKVVRITYRVHPDRVSLSIRDQGSGFNRQNLPHAARPEDPFGHLDVREGLGLREGGFGILIVRGLVDELRYNETGNEVTLTKRFRTEPEPKGR